LPAANSCHFPNWEIDISENPALAQPVPLCKHGTFSAMGATLSTLLGVRAPMFKTTPFLLGKQHFRSGTFPPCLAERRVGFVTLRVEGQFFANATFPIRKTTIPSPCAPAHAETPA
jgi:hypothetical protein